MCDLWVADCDDLQQGSGLELRRIGTRRHPHATRSRLALESCSRASPRLPSTGSIRARCGSRSTSAPGLPTFTIVGLGDAAVRESRDRVRSAIQNSGFEFPQTRITANLAPAFLRKVGPGFDAALALAVLAASGQIPPEALRSWAVFGELSLGGELRDSPGALAVAEGASRAGLRHLIVPRERAREAALVDSLLVAAVSTLAAAADVLRGGTIPALPPPLLPSADDAAGPDLADVTGTRRAAARAPDRRRRRPQPAVRGSARHGQDDARPADPLDPARHVADRGDRGDAHPQRGRAPRRRADHPAAVSRSAPHDLAGRTRRWAAPRPDPARRRWPTTASCSSTSCPSFSARASRRCVSRSRTARSRSSAASGRWCSRPGSCWWRPPTRARVASPAWRTGAPAARRTCDATGGG